MNKRCNARSGNNCRGLVILAIVAWLACSAERPAQNCCRAADPKTAEPKPADPKAVDKPRFTNHLINESSPYLLQHAHNPVQWYPWGQEAFNRAVKENKPIFLSIGYSTCYWCHVMERESFEDESVAKLLNDNFIAIKVDREERPELDEQYMVATELINGRGGWPNSLWLTPDRKPFLAGTYFPKANFKQTLMQVAATWRTKPDLVKREASQLASEVRAAGRQGAALGGPLDQRAIDQAVAEAIGSFDAARGGFGGAPKFPPHGRLQLLVEEYRRTGNKQLLTIVTRTLDAMADGGIHDQIGGGFHRYSTDASWFVPHFEKMLYDNAQLLRLYTDAYLLTKEPRYRRVAGDIAAWVAREMTDPQGGFYSALDAESEGEEGKFYVWTYNSLVQALGEADGRLFAQEYGARPEGNWGQQRSGRQSGTNILYRRNPAEYLTGQRREAADKLETQLAALRGKLLTVRDRRPRPRLDDKVLAGWNGLMIESLAYAGRTLDDPQFTAAAEKAAGCVFREMWRDGQLLHSYRQGQAHIAGYLDDYAYLGRGLLELQAATKNDRWSASAQQLADSMLKQFADAEQGAFFFTPAGDDGPLLRSKNLTGGGNLPGANGVAAELLLRLADLNHSAADHEAGSRTLSSLAGFARQRPFESESLLLATAYQLRAKPTVADAPVKPAAAPAAELHEPPITMRLYGAKSKVAPGKSFRVTVDLEIEPGWHLYAPSESKSVLPATVKLQKSEHATAESVKAPAGHALKDALLGEEVQILEGTAEYELKVAIDKDAPEGPVELKFEVRTQACNNHDCQAPRKSILHLPISVDRKATELSPQSGARTGE